MKKVFLNYGDDCYSKTQFEFNEWLNPTFILISKSEENSTDKETGEIYCKIVVIYKETETEK